MMAPRRPRIVNVLDYLEPKPHPDKTLIFKGGQTDVYRLAVDATVVIATLTHGQDPACVRCRNAGLRMRTRGASAAVSIRLASLVCSRPTMIARGAARP